MNRSVYVWLCSLIAAFGGFLWGYEVGSINGVKEMKDFRRTLNISYTDVTSASSSLTNVTLAQCSSEDDVETSALLGAIVSVFYVGALAGALFSGLLSDFAGRKVTVVIGASLWALGGATQTSSIQLWMMFLGRVISGMGIGVLLQVCPLYIAEIAPRDKRGVLGAFVNSFSTTGSVVGTLANVATKNVPFGWRIVLSLHFLCGIFLASAALLLPETPRFLVKKHKDAKALHVLSKIHKDNSEAQSVLVEIQLSTRSTTHESLRETLKYIFSKSILLRIFIGITLTLVVRGVGTSVIVVYSVSIFCKLGMDGYVSTIVVMLFNFVAQIFGVFIISKCGRKPLLLIGTMVMGGALALAATLVRVLDLEGSAEPSVGRTIAGYFVIALVTLYVCANTSTIATIVYIVLAEIYPIRIRGISAALSQLGWWGGILVLGQIGPVLIASPLKTSGTIYFLSGMCLLAFLHSLLFIPETKDQSLEDVDHLFTKSWWKRANVFYYLKCSCFYVTSSGMCKRRSLSGGQVVSEEREPLSEPDDAISLNSLDSADPEEDKLKETKSIAV